MPIMADGETEMARDDRDKQEDDEKVALRALLDSLDTPVDAQVVRGGYSQLSDFMQLSAAKK